MTSCNDSSSSKRRRLAPHGAAESWASLHLDLLEPIAWKVLAGDLRDYVRFRAVCAHWNSIAVRPHGRGLVDPRFHPRCWMLFPEGHGLYPGHPSLGGYVRFLNLSTGAFVRVHLPLFDDHTLLNSTDGILLLLRHHDTAIRLLNPFTGDIADLPPALPLLQQTKPQNSRYHYMTKDRKRTVLEDFLRVVSAAVTVSAAGAITVMLGLDQNYCVAYATAGDEGWSLSYCWKVPPDLRSRTVSFQGKLYAMAFDPADKNDYVCHIDSPQLSAEGCHMVSQPRPRKIVKCPLFADMCRVYLAQCGSELVLTGFSDTEYEHPVVYKLSDLIKGRVAPTTNMEEHAIFIGARCLCISLSVKWLPSVSSNSIVCRHRSTKQIESRINPLTGLAARLVPSRVEQYDLGSGTWSPALDEDIFSLYTTQMSPYTLAHHVFTCCYISYW
ncbi:hypothetical protein U9M48_017228 [Paspalum notatum var. saurae]|uniref:KIB1-4 beta-propeller domain-containing protein n=1 Tax=Paspalum notatum var. saurae TaxID=547442 RepID=A0AAQ3T906_PASNO